MVEPSRVETGTDIVDNFDDMGFKPDVLRGVYGYGFETPSLIQQRAIPIMLRGKDIIAQAQLGMGKTGAFIVSALQLINTTQPATQALILTSSHENAHQTASICYCVGEYLNVKVLRCTHVLVSVGYHPISENSHHIVVGTPEHVLEQLRNSLISRDSIRLIVLDQADQLLGPEFIGPVSEILGLLPGIQIGMFSATMPPEIVKTAQSFMREPETILLKNDEVIPKNIRQFRASVENTGSKANKLIEVLNVLEGGQIIVFCNTADQINVITSTMRALNSPHYAGCSTISADMDHDCRDITIRDVRTGKSRLLISTDIISRGIDIQATAFVINFDLPAEKETYIHRIGRSGRYGRKGAAISIVTPADTKFLRDLEETYSTEINELVAGDELIN